MTTLFPKVAQCRLISESDLLVVRNTTKQLALLVGLRSPDQTRLVTAVSEVARNALLYANGGCVNFTFQEQASKEFLQISVVDSGPGISDLTILDAEAAGLSGTHTSLTAIRRLVDRVEIETGHTGTTVIISKEITGLALKKKAIEKWADQLANSSPNMKLSDRQQSGNLILQDLQQQNKELMTALDEVQKVREELEERSLQLTHANRLKTLFLANVSHEIRTPMNAVLGLTNILEKRLVDSEDRRLIGLLHQSASSLLHIINDILDHSKIDEGKLLIKKENFSLINLIENVVDMFAAQSASRGIAVTASIDATIPAFVVSDENRIRQILVNLVGNALKFSKQGAIKISALRIWKHQTTIGVKIEVEDQGIGIEVADLDKLFKPFSQIDAAWSRRQTGTGLGLSICKRLVDLLDGKIGVNSKVDVGSTFWFELPLETVDDLTAEAEAVPEVYSFTGARVLLGEDHPVNQLVAANLLEELGVKVGVASNGIEVLEEINKQKYDLILLDCQMPKMNGFEATAAIRERESGTNNHVPIVAVTANAMTGDREHCLSLGMDDYISKPFSERDIARVLAKWLNKEQNAPVTPIDLAALFERYKKEQVTKLLKAFLDDSDSRMPEIQEALAKSDFDIVGKNAHAIKGACSLIFMPELAVICSALQQAAEQTDAARVEALFRSLNAQYSQIKIEASQIIGQIESEQSKGS